MNFDKNVKYFFRYELNAERSTLLDGNMIQWLCAIRVELSFLRIFP